MHNERGIVKILRFVSARLCQPGRAFSMCECGFFMFVIMYCFFFELIFPETHVGARFEKKIRMYARRVTIPVIRS